METNLAFLGGRFAIREAFAETPFERGFRALDRVLEREVLLKLPAREAWLGWSAPVKERMLREARALAKIRHENVAPIHHVEETADGPLLVLDLPEGELLAERLRRGPLEVDATIALGLQLAGALSQVHFNGVVHRGVGPSTVRLLANGRVQLGTFTFAKEFGVRGVQSSLAHARRSDVEINRFLPDYSAPEQVAGHAADPRADVFALGCTLFQCLTGREPFPPGREHDALPDVHALRREVGKPLAEVIQKCTLHAKAARYATAQEVVDALVAARARTGTQRRPTGRFVWLAATIIALVGSVAWLGFRPAEDADQRGYDINRDGRYAERFAQSYPGTYGRMHGLFVGIGKAYAGKSFAALRNPIREIEAVARTLAENDPAWAVDGAIELLRDDEATKRRIVDALNRIEAKAEENDGVLLYFAGHGSRDGAQFALAAADVTGPDLEFDSGHLSRGRLLNFVTRCRAKHVLVVLDCCHAGAVFDTEATRGRTPDDVTMPGAFHLQHFSREFLCSAGADESAKDGTDLSPFCSALLERLTAPAGAGLDYIAARHLGSEIGRVMEQRTGNRCVPMQVPEIRQMLHQKGSFVFRLRK